MYTDIDEARSEYRNEFPKHDSDRVNAIMDMLTLLTKDEFERFIGTLEADYDLKVEVN